MLLLPIKVNDSLDNTSKKRERANSGELLGIIVQATTTTQRLVVGDAVICAITGRLYPIVTIKRLRWDDELNVPIPAFNEEWEKFLEICGYEDMEQYRNRIRELEWEPDECVLLECLSKKQEKTYTQARDLFFEPINEETRQKAIDMVSEEYREEIAGMSSETQEDWIRILSRIEEIQTGKE